MLKIVSSFTTDTGLNMCWCIDLYVAYSRLYGLLFACVMSYECEWCKRINGSLQNMSFISHTLTCTQ